MKSTEKDGRSDLMTEEFDALASTRCPHDEFCGGCTYQEIPYEEQLKIKEQEVRQLFQAG